MADRTPVNLTAAEGLGLGRAVRVLLLAPGYPVDGDLFGHAVAEQVSALAKLHEIRVQSLVPIAAPRARSRGVDVYSVAGGRTRRLLTIAARHAAWRPDVLWSLWAATSGSATVLARLLRRPLVASVMGGEVANLPDLGYGGARTRLGRLRVRSILREARVVTVGSRWLAARVTALVPGVRPLDVPIGVRPDAVPVRTSGPWREGPLRLCAVVDASPVKGAPHILGALSWLRARGVEADLTVFNLSPEHDRSKLLAMADAANVTQWLELAPPTPAPALYQRLPRFDVLVSASAHESQGLAMIEAALAEVPVVAPDVGVARDLSVMGALRLASSLTPERLGTAILEAAGRETTARSMVTERFGLAACTERFDQVLRRAAG